MRMPTRVKMVEVGPRDGLQNEPRNVPTSIKLKLIKLLESSGLETIEATSFVSPKRVPQMADHQELMSQLDRKASVHYPVLVPNVQGLEKALAVGVKEIAVFCGASETFSQKNINCSIAESLARVKEVITIAKEQDILVRGYLSCVMGCPYEGEISSEKVAELASMLYRMGCYEISLGDTIGIGTVPKTQVLIKTVLQFVPLEVLAVHFHDTYGQALTNIYAALQLGVSVIDSSVAGLGGCPYARGASGNVASEDVLCFLNGLGIETGVSLNQLAKAGKFICDYLQRPNHSKAGIASLFKLEE